MKARLFAPENRRWWTLAAVTFGLFMILLDNTVVNVALPAMQRDLHLRAGELEWVVVGYSLSFATFMLTGGKLADLLGRRLLFVVGLFIFSAASLACGLAGSAALLIGARVVQGVGAALISPATLGIITATFPPRQRGTAIGIWAGTSASALAIGPLVGGLLTEKINWNWIFYINVPVGIVGIAMAFWAIDESRDTSREQRLDLPGLLTSGAGLFALTYGLIEANNYGWTSKSNPRALRRCGGFAHRVRRRRIPPAAPDARARSLPQCDLLRRQRGDPARRVRIVRNLLLQLALHPERTWLLPDPDGRRLLADDGADRPDRSASRKADRLDWRALAHRQRPRPLRCLDAALRPTRPWLGLLEHPPGWARSRRGHRADNDPGDDGCDGLGPGRPRRRRLGSSEHVAPAWRIPRARDHGRSGRQRSSRPTGQSRVRERVHLRLPRRALPAAGVSAAGALIAIAAVRRTRELEVPTTV